MSKTSENKFINNFYMHIFFSLGDADFIWIKRLGIQSKVEAENFRIEQNSTPVKMSTLFK